MPRKPRRLTEAGVYHVVTRGNNRQKLFRKEADFRFYLSLIEGMKMEYTFELYHYCLMTNHVHQLMRFYDAESLQKAMQRINLRYAKRYRREYKYFGHVYQDRFKSFEIHKDSHLLDCGRYIERNPLKARMVRDLKDYPWSSFGYYAYGQMMPLITRNPLYHGLGRTEQERSKAYRRYVLTDRPYEEFIDQAILGH